MANFGNDIPALWDSGKEQRQTIVASQTSVVGQSSILTFANAHDYEKGMLLHVRLEADAIYTDQWCYVIGLLPDATKCQVDYDFGTPSSISLGFADGFIALEHAIYEDTGYVIPDKVKYKSVVNGKKSKVYKGHYTNYKFTINLLNYPGTNRVNLSKLLYSLNGSEVLFYPHIEKDNLKNSLNQDVEFDIDVLFYYLSTIDFRDRCKINLESNDYVDLDRNIG